MLSNDNTSNGRGFTGDNNEQLWPESNYPSSSTSEAGMPTGVDSGLVNQSFFEGQDVGMRSTRGLTSPPISPTTAAMDRGGNCVYATHGFSREPSNLGALSPNYTYSFPATLAGLTPHSIAAMYGSRWGCPNGPPSLPSPSWLPFSPPASSPPRLPLSPAIPSRPHVCTLCPDTTNCFTLKKDLNRHIRTVHATGVEQVYRCRCKKHGIRKDNYLRHVHRCNKEHDYSHYTCKCLSSCAEKQEHIHHVTTCQYGLGTPGRPRLSAF
ncbi:hypothetical protein F5B21DRAFT_488254 [Xylaria acuta]|nr:hypothetical protein F5B21DRAFT_488254 [Xylaria acuta]